MRQGLVQKVFFVYLSLLSITRVTVQAGAAPSWHPHRTRSDVPEVMDAESVEESHGGEFLKVLMSQSNNSSEAGTTFLEAARAHNKLLKPAGGGCSGKRRVFNIGLPRTGTLSLVDVFKTLGMGTKACHQFPDWQWKDVRAFVDDHTAKAPSVRAGMKKCMHLGDIPTYGMVESLAKAYPRSAFVMTTRELDTWLSSTEKLLAFWVDKLRGDYGHYHKWYFGTKTPAWEREAWTQGYMRHHQKALNLIGDRLLLIPTSMPDDEKMKQLSWFLNCNSKVKYAKKHVGNKWRVKGDPKGGKGGAKRKGI
mmetsp:Transcript_13064/g.15759  ORF Transcript_13064/g.15759 Transcript_13064/m.15759 type:complete len:307 (-) Transcript_13064:355-1275(-)|eukprot:CAMPEP_0197853968 /NCGR_PEP_ID=MMETSP1438-20131217/23801_1 /TAXON_ID=1461541 /ORGANISM="Pterosperma sp., Strain CCMP1384" /LENGTH=306 /DNA_ID=CAMNT_0043468561 /DNA_START=292 /DNA_END=1212 /DNA_ORIENTATION=+